MELVNERYRRKLCRFAIRIQTFEVVRDEGSSRKHYFVFPLPAAGHDVKAARSGMRRQLAPFDLVGIFFVDLSHPTLVGNDVTRVLLFCPIHVHDSLVRDSASVTIHRGTGKSRGLAPGVFLCVVYLNIVHRSVLRPSTDDVDIAIVS